MFSLKIHQLLAINTVRGINDSCYGCLLQLKTNMLFYKQAKFTGKTYFPSCKNIESLKANASVGWLKNDQFHQCLKYKGTNENKRGIFNRLYWFLCNFCNGLLLSFLSSLCSYLCVSVKHRWTCANINDDEVFRK